MKKLLTVSATLLLLSSMAVQAMEENNNNADQAIEIFKTNYAQPQWFFEDQTPNQFRQQVDSYKKSVENKNRVQELQQQLGDYPHMQALKQASAQTAGSLQDKESHHFWKTIRRGFYSSCAALWLGLLTKDVFYKPSLLKEDPRALHIIAGIGTFVLYNATTSGKDHFDKYKTTNDLSKTYQQHVKKSMDDLD